jgi:hypothetical protein
MMHWTHWRTSFPKPLQYNMNWHRRCHGDRRQNTDYQREDYVEALRINMLSILKNAPSMIAILSDKNGHGKIDDLEVI